MRVLVLESNIIHQYYLKSQLEDAGFLVDTTDSINQAELFIISNKPIIILMNVDSIEKEAILAIRKWNREGRKIRIMVLNNKEDLSYKINALNSGADDYIIKPCQIQEIIIRVWVLIRRSFCVPTQKIKAGKIVLDLSSKALHIDNNIIRLTKFEFEIMNLLMKNMGGALSKRRIMNHIYNDSATKDNNTVEVIIGRLRKKIAAYNGGEIKNRRDDGYYLQANHVA